MNRKIPPKIFIFTIILLLFVSLLKAQDQPGNQFEENNKQRNDRQRLIEYLELTPEQVGQIRMVRGEIAPQLREATIRQRDARRNLNRALYADALDEAEIQLYLKDLMEAQAQVTRLRTRKRVGLKSGTYTDST